VRTCGDEYEDEGNAHDESRMSVIRPHVPAAVQLCESKH
jgi:hypothetical protein